MESEVIIEKRNGGCGVIFENKLYVWGGNTTEKYKPYANLQLDDSSSSDSEDSDADGEETAPGPSFDPNLEMERAVILPKPSDERNPFDVLDLSTLCWSQQSTAGEVPRLGYGSSLNVHIHDSTGTLYLYGGWKDGEFDSEVYTVTVDDSDPWTWKVVQLSTKVKPSPRYLTGVVMHGNHMTMFGGVGKEIVEGQDQGAEYKAYVMNGVERYFGWNNEYYEFDVYSHEWKAPLGTNVVRPGPIGAFAFTKFDSERAIMFGGSGSRGRMNEVYILHLEERKWDGPLVPSLPEQPWPIPTRFTTFTPLVEPKQVGKKLSNGHGPELEQKLLLLWGKATPHLICPDTWLLEVKEFTRREEKFELKWTRLYIPLKPRSWHIARPVYMSNSTECDVVIFGGNVHIEGHYGNRDNTADLKILSSGVKTLVNHCLSVIVSCDSLQVHAQNSNYLPSKCKDQIRSAVSLHQNHPKVRIATPNSSMLHVPQTFEKLGVAWG